MKKFLRAVLILIVIAASVGGTCYAFYKNYTARKSSFNYVSSFLVSGERREFDGNLTKTRDLGGNRFNLIINVNNDLEEITDTLNAYLTIADRYDVNENALVDKLEEVSIARSKANAHMQEYFIHCEQSPYFNRSTGANVAYNSICEYLVSFADFILNFNNMVSSYINFSSDVKFAIIDLYSRVVMNDFNAIEVGSDNISNIKTTSNINLLVGNIDFVSGYLNAGDLNSSFGLYAVNLANTYRSCNVNTLATNLFELVTASNADSTEINSRVAYLFKQIFSIV